MIEVHDQKHATYGYRPCFSNVTFWYFVPFKQTSVTVIILEGMFSKNDFLTSFSSDYNSVCKNFRVELNKQLRFISKGL